MRDQLRTFFDEHHVPLKQQWFEAGMSYLAQALPQNEEKPKLEKYAQLVYDQWLYSDLTESTEPIQQFPANAKRLVIAKRVLLQVNHVVDISTPAYAQYRALINATDDSDLPEEDDDTVKDFASKRPTKSAKLHLLELTDGRSVVKALFLDAELNARAATLAPGTKILLVDKANYRSGCLQLTAANSQVLGGDVEKLLSDNTLLKVISHRLKINDDLAKKHLAHAKNLRQMLIETSDPSKVVAQEAVRETQKANESLNGTGQSSLNNSDVSKLALATKDRRNDSGFSEGDRDSLTTGRRSEDSFFGDRSRWSPIPPPEPLPRPRESAFDMSYAETIADVECDRKGALSRRHYASATKTVFPKVFEESHRGQQDQSSTRNYVDTSYDSFWLGPTRPQKRESLNQSVLAGIDTDCPPRPATRRLLGSSFDSEFARPAPPQKQPRQSTMNRSSIQPTANERPLSANNTFKRPHEAVRAPSRPGANSRRNVSFNKRPHTTAGDVSMVPETPMPVIAGRERQSNAFHGPMDMFLRKIKPPGEPVKAASPDRGPARADLPPPPATVVVKQQNSTAGESMFKAPAPPQPPRSLLSDAYKGNTSAKSSSTTGSMSGNGSTSSVVQRPSSSTVAKAPMRAVASVQPHKPPQAIHPAKRPQQEYSDNNPDGRRCSTSSSAVVPFKRPASSAHLNEGRAHGAPSAQAPRTEGIAASHQESDGFPLSAFANPRVVELRVPHHPKGQLAAFVPKAPRDLGKDPLVEKYRSLGIRQIAEVVRNKRYLALPATRRILPLHCAVAPRFDPKGERWTLKALVADESTETPLPMVVCHELIMRMFKFSVAECKIFRETNDSEKIEECKRNFGLLQHTLARADIVLELELSSDPLPLVVNATTIGELLNIV